MNGNAITNCIEVFKGKIIQEGYRGTIRKN